MRDFVNLDHWNKEEDEAERTAQLLVKKTELEPGEELEVTKGENLNIAQGWVLDDPGKRWKGKHRSEAEHLVPGEQSTSEHARRKRQPRVVQKETQEAS